MKENSFRFRESFGRAILSMNDKQAGQLIKGLCGYVFEGRKLQSNDCAIKSSFTLIKTALDTDEQNKQNARLYRIMNAEKSKKKESILVIADIKNQDCPMEKALQNILSDLTESQPKDGGTGIAKT